MIRVDKGNEPNNSKLSETIDLAFEKLEEFYDSKNRDQKRYDFPFNSDIDYILRLYLHKIFNGKCGYCESKIESDQFGVIDRFRPYNGVREKNVYFEDLYWWLVYDWENLVYSCKECSQYKANYFPIKGRRIFDPNGDLEEERRNLLNPCLDYPEQHLKYSTDGSIYSSSEEGYQTIELLRLNRSDLVNKRFESRKAIINVIETVIKGTQSAEAVRFLKGIHGGFSEIEYLGYNQWILFNELNDTPFLGKLLDLDDDDSNLIYDFDSNDNEHFHRDLKSNNIILSDYFPIEYINIKNFKSITDLEIQFNKDDLDKNSWIFILGENGVGKSSILQAIALGFNSALVRDQPNKILSLIQKGKHKAEITIKERESDNIIKTVLIRKDKSVSQTGIFNSFLIGYGSLRLSSEDYGEKIESDLKKVSYENLFNQTRPLNDVTKWLRGIYNNNISIFNSIAYSIKQLLPHDFIDNELTIKGSELMFKNSEKLFSELSDGFKSTITLAIDIMMKLSSAQADMNKMSGIVLIDELGNQLHPRWQMRIVSQLRTVFPRITFIISTHHPLCLRGSQLGEIVLLKNIDSEVEAIVDLPNPSELRVDQLLASEFFGLNSLIDPELEATFNRYYELLSLQSEISLNEKHELNKLKDELRDKKHLGSSLREELMYSVIDNLLAQKIMFSKDLLNRENLKKETIDRVRDIWTNLNIKTNDQS